MKGATAMDGNTDSDIRYQADVGFPHLRLTVLDL
jgi:hypothetical protein